MKFLWNTAQVAALLTALVALAGTGVAGDAGAGAHDGSLEVVVWHQGGLVERFPLVDAPAGAAGAGASASKLFKQGSRNASKEGIFGADTRKLVSDTTVYPWSAIVSVGGTCSGVMISERHVLTAGHCVHWYGGWDEMPSVTPGLSGRTAPYGSVEVEQMCVPSRWADDRDDRYDIAVLTLSEPIGDRVGWLGMRTRAKVGNTVNVAGYPGDRAVGTQWRESCEILGLDDDFVHYRCDSHGGLSGGGVYIYHADKNERYVLAVHESSSRNYNRAVRLTDAKWDFVESIAFPD